MPKRSSRVTSSSWRPQRSVLSMCSLQQFRECVDFMIPLNESHIRIILKPWVAHFNEGRPHSSLGPRDTRAIISEGPAPEQAAISCINSTNSCNFCLLVDFLHHPTFPPRRKLRGFFCLTRTGRGQLQILSMAQTSSRVVSDSNSGLITNSPCTGRHPEPHTRWRG